MEMVAMANARRTNIKQIANFASSAMVMITKAKAVTVRTIDHVTGKLILQAKSGLGDEWIGRKTIHYNGSIIEAAASSGKPLKVRNLSSDSRYGSPSLARKNNLRSAFVVPLMVKGEPIGSFTLYFAHAHNLESLEEEFIEIFAQETAIAFKLTAK